MVSFWSVTCQYICDRSSRTDGRAGLHLIPFMLCYPGPRPNSTPATKDQDRRDELTWVSSEAYKAIVDTEALVEIHRQRLHALDRSRAEEK